jgi:sugar/nucleoside kinase (ribokinase family)
MNNRTEIIKTAEMIEQTEKETSILCGFDGFVDEICHVVDKRQDIDSYTRIKTISDYAERIGRASKQSTNIELITKQMRMGGNGPLLAAGMLNLGSTVFYIGALGKTKVHPIFSEFTQKTDQFISISDPGNTIALEFYDGKLMMGKMEQLKEVSWNNLAKQLSEAELKNILKQADLVAVTNWTMLANLPSILSVLKKMIEKMDKKERPVFFFDLADPNKRSAADIAGILEFLSDLQFHTSVVLGMNNQESIAISDVLNISEANIPERAGRIRSRLNLGGIVIHPINGAALATKNGIWWQGGPYTETPKSTTGAGDKFNAGLCYAWQNGLSEQQCLIVATGMSGYYVRYGSTPSKKGLVKFLHNWAN